MREGVALFLLREDGTVFTVREKKSKREIGKSAGMLSIPMETINDGEKPIAALNRLLEEEIGLAPSAIAPEEIGWVTFEPVSEPGGIPYRILGFVAVVARERTLALAPGDSEDVEPAGWRTLAEIMAWRPPESRRELPQLLEALLCFWGG